MNAAMVMPQSALVPGAAPEAGANSRPLEVLTLAMQGETLAIEARHVREILDLVPITEVPGAPRFLNGLINVRGKVVPLADLRLKLGMQVAPPTIDTRIVVVEIDVDGEPTIVGLRADKVYEITDLAAGSLEETPPIGMRWRSDYVRCIGKRGADFIIVLDLERILAVSAGSHPS